MTTETILPTEEVDDTLLTPSTLTEEIEVPIESVIETRDSNVENDSFEAASLSPSPVTDQEAEQLEKEISHLRQEAYGAPEFSEEHVYENV